MFLAKKSLEQKIFGVVLGDVFVKCSKHNWVNWNISSFCLAACICTVSKVTINQFINISLHRIYIDSTERKKYIQLV